MPPELEGISEFFDDGGGTLGSLLLPALRELIYDGRLIALLFALPGLLLVAWLNRRYQSALGQYLQIPSQNGFTGVSAARHLLERAGVLGVRVVPTEGSRVTDHYHPLTKELALSHGIFHSSSLAALGIAAHEVGHAVQHARNYFPVWVRMALVPVTNACFILGMGAVSFGMVYSSALVWIGVAVFAGSLLFPVVTLPVEFNASARGRELALQTGIIQPAELAGMDRVLRAAALTYVGKAVATGFAFLGFALMVALLLMSRKESSTAFAPEDNPLVGIITAVVFLIVVWSTQQRRPRRKMSPPGVADLNRTGNIHASQGEYVQAIAAFTKALHLDPQRAEIYANRGIAYYHTQQYDEALADLDTAIRLAPGLAEAYGWRGTVRFARHEYEQAVADYDVALKHKPDNVAVLNNRGRAWLQQKDLVRARADFERALTRAPEDGVSYFNRGILWVNQEDYDRALADFDQAIACNDNLAESYAQRGTVWLVKGEHDRAINDYNEALRRGADRAAVLRDRGLAWYWKGNITEAIADLNESIRLNGEDAVSYNNRAAAFQKKGEYAGAASDLQQALRLNPNLPNAYKNLAWQQATCLQPEFRDGAAAVANASRALQLANGKAPAWLEILAAAHAEAGNFEEAVCLQTKCLAESAAGPKPEMQARLDLYRTKQPFRESLVDPSPAPANPSS